MACCRGVADDEHHGLKLVGRVAGLTVPTQISSGSFDAAGVPPLRFTEQRLPRGTKAANFQRDAGKISFSGLSTEFAPREGAQDRLSGMVQLGAVVAAEPLLRGVGTKAVMFVAGANGDAGVWAFDCVAVETVATRDRRRHGECAQVRARSARALRRARVQVWLEPAQHYLPVRATQKSGLDDEGFELRQQSVEANP